MTQPAVHGFLMVELDSFNQGHDENRGNVAK